MNAALNDLFKNGPPKSTDVDTFLESTKFPLVEGDEITFIYHGEADEVFLRSWISGLNAAQPLEQLPDSKLWAVTVDLPAGSRIEYKLEVVSGAKRALILDPLNKVIAQDPFGANSVCQGDGYHRPAWTLTDPEAPEGVYHHTKIASKSFAEERDLHIYLPARFRRNRRYPLLIVHDGRDYMEFAALGTVLDNLIHSLEIPQMIVVMTQSPDRLAEYAANDKHAAFIAEDLLPFMGKHYPLIDEPQARCIMGASFGAVATLHTAWRYPSKFGRLLLQSGSFAFSDLGQHQRGPVFDPVVRFMNEFRQAPGLPAEKMYVSCGIYESLIYENRSLVPFLQRQQIDVHFEEVRDAHNWENWRDRLRVGISSLFPGPVWMVYE